METYAFRLLFRVAVAVMAAATKKEHMVNNNISASHAHSRIMYIHMHMYGRIFLFSHSVFDVSLMWCVMSLRGNSVISISSVSTPPSCGDIIPELPGDDAPNTSTTDNGQRGNKQVRTKGNGTHDQHR